MNDNKLKIKKLYSKKNNVLKRSKMKTYKYKTKYINNYNLKISKNKASGIKRKYLTKVLFLITLLIIIIFIHKYQYLFIKSEKNISIINDNEILKNKTTEKDVDKEYEDIQNYIDLLLNNTKIDKDKIYYPSQNPKISIVITVYNGEAYLKTNLLSIQNQDLKDIEIIMVEDGSQDNSVNLIKELMKTEPRIVLLENKENKGHLYSITKGVLNSRGKYVMSFDEDDIYVQRDAFSSLYIEAERNNLDLIWFMGANSEELAPRSRKRFSDTNNIMLQPELSDLMYKLDSDGKVRQFPGSFALFFIKTNLCKKAIKLIDEKNLNTYMNHHADFVMMFLLLRNANNLKTFNRLLHVWLHIWKKDDPKVKYRTEIKRKTRHDQMCFSTINFADILFKNTKNNYKDKKIAFSQVERWYLNTYCRTNKDYKERAIEVFKSYLNCEYISNEDKKKLQDFINNLNNI